MPTGRQVFDQTLYGSSSGGGGGGGGGATVMGGPADIAKSLNLRPQRKQGRAKRQVKRKGRAGRR